MKKKKKYITRFFLMVRLVYLARGRCTRTEGKKDDGHCIESDVRMAEWTGFGLAASCFDRGERRSGTRYSSGYYNIIRSNRRNGSK